MINEEKILENNLSCIEKQLIFREVALIVCEKAISLATQSSSEISSEISKIDTEINANKSFASLSFFNPIKNITMLNCKENSSEEKKK